MTEDSIFPEPYFFGLPEHFQNWRPGQAEACDLILSSGPRFLATVCPTGFGKSIVYMTAAAASKGRAVILTSTKGLQAQLLHEFGEIVVDIRGKNNYPCRLNSKLTCDSGICAFGVPCSMKTGGGCEYYDTLKKARRAKIVVTNYSYWMAQNEYGDGLGPFDILVLDEAHAAVDHVISHISVEFSKRNKVESRFLDLGQVPNDLHSWVAWAKEKLEDAKAEAEDAKERRKEKRFVTFSRLAGKLEKLATRMDRSWVWESGPEKVILSPIWPRNLAEGVLFLEIPRVVLTSATIVPKTASLLGIDEDDLQHVEFPHSFPVENRRLVHVPTVRLNYRAGEVEFRKMMGRIDEILRAHPEEKGIVHTVSYARRDMVMERSVFGDRLVTHGRRNAESAVRSFKDSMGAPVLVSPSMITGWDFPYDECRFQIIVKLPYPDMRGPVIKRRGKEDRDFVNYMVVQQLIQATGRGCRAEDDYCTTYIIDNNVEWFLEQNGHLLVDWFRDSFTKRLKV